VAGSHRGPTVAVGAERSRAEGRESLGWAVRGEGTGRERLGSAVAVRRGRLAVDGIGFLAPLYDSSTRRDSGKRLALTFKTTNPTRLTVPRA
jgi:hypothetical protein